MDIQFVLACVQAVLLLIVVIGSQRITGFFSRFALSAVQFTLALLVACGVRRIGAYKIKPVP